MVSRRRESAQGFVIADVWASGSPEWARTCFRADDGEYYLPACAANVSETVAMMSATWDGVGIIIEADHTYYPVSWLMREYPEVATRLADIRRKLEALRPDKE